MIKNDELIRARATAEQQGTADAWAVYAELLEGRVVHPHSAWLYDPADTDRTKDSEGAQEAAARALQYFAGLGTTPVQLMQPFPGFVYVAEVRGQRSATAHGMQGLRPLRLRVLADIDPEIPVWLAFQDGKGWQTAWLAELGPARAISKGDDGDKDATARWGWPVASFVKMERLQFPTEYAPRPVPQESLV